MQTHTKASSDHTEQQQTNAAQRSAQLVVERQATFEDNRPEAVVQRQLQALVPNSPQMAAGRALQAMMNNSPQSRVMRATQRAIDAGASAQKMEDAKPLQREGAAAAPKANNTGLSDNLKAGIERLSGYSMDGVKVHYNSDKPAQLQAHAYAQATKFMWRRDRNGICRMKPGMWCSKSKGGLGPLCR